MNNKQLMVGVLSLATVLGTFSSIYAAEEGTATAKSEEQTQALDLSKDGYKGWKSIDNEASLTFKEEDGKPIMVFKVVVDLLKDGKGNTESKWLKGWPRIYRYFNPKVDLTKYKEFVFEYKIVGKDRQNVDKTPIYTYLNSSKGGGVTWSFDAGKQDGQWHTQVVKIADVIKKSGKTADDWKELGLLQFGMAESNYTDKTEVVVEIKNLQLQ